MSDVVSDELRAEIENLTYAIGHDLRAPLRAIVGYAAALDEDFGTTFDDEARRFLAIVSSEASRAMGMLDGLLEISRIARVELAFETIDMTALARDVAVDILPLRDERVTIDPLPATTGDRALLRTIWSELIANAAIATDDLPSARISITSETEADRVVYRVTDTGIGFDMTYRDKLFRPFAKLHHADRFPGRGTGLAIADRIVRRHGGSAWADGRPDGGASFAFALPRAVAS